jgi:hypothetical protein
MRVISKPQKGCFYGGLSAGVSVSYLVVMSASHYTLLFMKLTKNIIAIFSLLMAAYYFIKRADIVREAFKLGVNAVPLGQLLLPITLLMIGIILLRIQPKKNE